MRAQEYKRSSATFEGIGRGDALPVFAKSEYLADSWD